LGRIISPTAVTIAGSTRQILAERATLRAVLPYRLDELGWLQFEELCQGLLKAALGMGIQAWGGSGDFGRDAFYEEVLPFPLGSEPSDGPFIFQVKFVSAANATGARSDAALNKAVRAEATRIKERLDDRRWTDPRQYVLLTNAPVNDTLRDALATLIAAVLPNTTFAVQSGRDICAILDGMPEVRLSFPQILGLADLKALISEELLADITNRTEATVKLAHQEALRFVPTAAYRRALFLLENDHTVVLTGPPEVGKTTIARILALGFMAEGWEVFDCRTPNDLLRARRPSRKQLFIADDAFGSTEYRPDIADEWAAEMETILTGVDSRHRLIWTSRAAVLKAALAEIGLKGLADDWPDPDKVEIDAGVLSIEEKALMAYRHSRAAGLSEDAKSLMRAHAPKAVEHTHFTPERIARFVRTRLPQVAALPQAERVRGFSLAVDEEMAEPTKPMRASYDRLRDEDRRILIAMLDAGSSAVTRTELDSAYIRAGGHADLTARLDVLGGHFLRVQPGDSSVAWMHPSWRDLVIDSVAADPTARRAFLSRCGAHGIILALSKRGGLTGARDLPFLTDSEDWEVLADHMPGLVRHVSDSDVARLLSAVAELAKYRSGALVSRFTRLALDQIRDRWNSRGQAITIWSLGLYYDTSERLEPLAAGPDLRATWDATHPGTSFIDTTEHDLLDHTQLTRLRTWLQLVSMIRDNEPRFLRQAGFPGADDGLAAKVATLAANELDADWQISDIDEYDGAAHYASETAETLKALGEHCPNHQEVLSELADQAREQAESFEERVRELEEQAAEYARDADWDEPDGPDEDVPEPFSILALMCDL
jgi:hypothetical protein